MEVGISQLIAGKKPLKTFLQEAAEAIRRIIEMAKT